MKNQIEQNWQCSGRKITRWMNIFRAYKLKMKAQTKAIEELDLQEKLYLAESDC